MEFSWSIKYILKIAGSSWTRGLADRDYLLAWSVPCRTNKLWTSGKITTAMSGFSIAFELAMVYWYRISKSVQKSLIFRLRHTGYQSKDSNTNKLILPIHKPSPETRFEIPADPVLKIFQTGDHQYLCSSRWKSGASRGFSFRYLLRLYPFSEGS